MEDIDKDVKDFREKVIESLRSADVNINNFDIFMSDVEKRLVEMRAFEREKTKEAHRKMLQAEEKIKEGREANYPIDNPFLMAAEILISAWNDVAVAMAWLRNQIYFLKVEREKLYGILRKESKKSKDVEIIKADKERIETLSEKQMQFFEKRINSLEERERSVMNNLIGRMSEIENKFIQLKDEVREKLMESVDQAIKKEIEKLRQENESLRMENNELKEKLRERESITPGESLPSETPSELEIPDFFKQRTTDKDIRVLNLINEMGEIDRKTIENELGVNCGWNLTKLRNLGLIKKRHKNGRVVFSLSDILTRKG